MSAELPPSHSCPFAEYVDQCRRFSSRPVMVPHPLARLLSLDRDRSEKVRSGLKSRSAAQFEGAQSFAAQQIAFVRLNLRTFFVADIDIVVMHWSDCL